ncbi:hypothetical protein PR202_gb11412 [Eleusine coracana subsp. coracana]|uniref:Uncharacterized protein n=1 Tax=Eleusine coracana subsp. coracana TaxID=191504 RepID=A0AAV5EMH4_ELECO|nr:hypothetical protein PR202_gb11412 [Eleusine coracana subsp. coracana]
MEGAFGLNMGIALCLNRKLPYGDKSPEMDFFKAVVERNLDCLRGKPVGRRRSIECFPGPFSLARCVAPSGNPQSASHSSFHARVSRFTLFLLARPRAAAYACSIAATNLLWFPFLWRVKEMAKGKDAEGMARLANVCVGVLWARSRRRRAWGGWTSSDAWWRSLGSISMAVVRTLMLIAGITALSSAALDGKLDTVRYLLDNGADPNKKDDPGSVPLHCAAKNGSFLHRAPLQ